MTARWILAALAGIGLWTAMATPSWGNSEAPTPHSLWKKAEKDAETDSETAGSEEEENQTGFGSKRPDSGSLFTQSLAAVLVILVLGAGAFFVVKRLLPRFGISQGRRINVLETVYLGSRKSLHMVQVGDRTLLVADTRERLGLLADLTGSVDVDEVLPAPVRRKKPTFVIPAADPEDR